MKPEKGRKKFFTIPQLVGLGLLGIFLGSAPFLLSKSLLLPMQSTDTLTEENAGWVAYRPLYSENIIACRALCYQPPERPASEPSKKTVTRGVPRPSGITRLADLPKNPKNPNAIRISLREAPPILAKVKIVNGRPTCAKKNDKGSKSDKYDHVHVDQECCLDPDEIPNPRCFYQ